MEQLGRVIGGGGDKEQLVLGEGDLGDGQSVLLDMAQALARVGVVEAYGAILTTADNLLVQWAPGSTRNLFVLLYLE